MLPVIDDMFGVLRVRGVSLSWQIRTELTDSKLAALVVPFLPLRTCKSISEASKTDELNSARFDSVQESRIHGRHFYPWKYR